MTGDEQWSRARESGQEETVRLGGAGGGVAEEYKWDELLKSV